MSLFVTEFNRTRAGLLVSMIQSGRVIIPVKAPPEFPQEQINPWFIHILRSGNTGWEQVANAQALANELEKDAGLRRLAEVQRIEMDDLRNMIADAEQELKENPTGIDPDRERSID